jgi:serine/threonine protein kinase
VTDEARRYARVKAIFQAALDRQPADRSAYLDEACKNDPLLRVEVEALLSARYHAVEEHFAERPAVDVLPLIPPPSLAIGQRLDHYEIRARVAGGGMGVVYKAWDTRPKLDRAVAIKVLRPDLRDHPDYLERFDKEARALASLGHPNICAVFDVGHTDGIDYLVMEYVKGETLKARLDKGPLTIPVALQLAIQIAEALEAAHQAGIVHHDLKPSNVMVTKGAVRLLDFGLAKFDVSRRGTPESSEESRTIRGTAEYMAPEQIEGMAVDARTDLFAFGVVLYEMLTAERPFEGHSLAGLFASILKDEPQGVSSIRPLVPVALDRVVQKCLAKDPDDRWQTARDLCDVLRWIAMDITPPPTPKHTVLSWVTLGLFAGATAATALFYLRTGRSDRPTTLAPAAANIVVTMSPDVVTATLCVPPGCRSTDGKYYAWRAMGGVIVREMAGVSGTIDSIALTSGVPTSWDSDLIAQGSGTNQLGPKGSLYFPVILLYGQIRDPNAFHQFVTPVVIRFTDDLGHRLTTQAVWTVK